MNNNDTIFVQVQNGQVIVTVWYNEDVRQILCSFNEEQPIGTFKGDRKTILLEQMKRRSDKRQGSWYADAQLMIENKTGIVYDELVKFCDERKLVL